MPYLPSPETIAALGFTQTESYAWPTPCAVYKHPTGPVVVVWPEEGIVRITQRHISALGLEYWPATYTGPVADEAAFRSLVARHFPAPAL